MQELEDTNNDQLGEQVIYTVLHRVIKYVNSVEEIVEQVQEITESIFMKWSMKMVVDCPTPVDLPHWPPKMQ